MNLMLCCCFSLVSVHLAATFYTKVMERSRNLGLVPSAVHFLSFRHSYMFLLISLLPSPECKGVFIVGVC